MKRVAEKEDKEREHWEASFTGRLTAFSYERENSKSY